MARSSLIGPDAGYFKFIFFSYWLRQDFSWAAIGLRALQPIFLRGRPLPRQNPPALSALALCVTGDGEEYGRCYLNLVYIGNNAICILNVGIYTYIAWNSLDLLPYEAKLILN